jgi:hypothetical protein
MLSALDAFLGVWDDGGLAPSYYYEAVGSAAVGTSPGLADYLSLLAKTELVAAPLTYALAPLASSDFCEIYLYNDSNYPFQS